MTGEAVRITLDLALLLVAGRLGGVAAERLGQPPVLGEILAGLVLGPSLLGHWHLLPDLAGVELGAQVIAFLAGLGAVLLLFEVGLESDLAQMRRVGASSLLVATLGVVLSFALGFGLSFALARYWPTWDAALPVLHGNLLHLFVGATFTATSVGITARVLSDMGKLRTGESRIILGAAVLDDVAGLLILAVITALVASASTGQFIGGLALARILAVALGFLLVAVLVGFRAAPRLLDLAGDRFKAPGALVVLGVAFALLMSYLGAKAGLAAIVGAFVAGLLLAPARHAHRLFGEVRPVGALFVPLFFVTVGMRADLTQLGGHGLAVLGIGIGLGAAAILAKLACGLGVVRRQADRLVVGVGMVPRGEVGLIFASLGLSSGLIANWQFVALLIAVFLTTLITPPWLNSLSGRFTHDAMPARPGSDALAHILEP